jgi:hypothetical protein
VRCPPIPITNAAIPAAELFVVERRGEVGIGFRIDSDAVPSWSLGEELARAVPPPDDGGRGDRGERRGRRRLRRSLGRSRRASGLDRGGAGRAIAGGALGRTGGYATFLAAGGANRPEAPMPKLLRFLIVE